MTRYISELMRVKNNKTGKYFYYKKVCGVYQRIKKADFEMQRDTACGLENITITVEKQFTRHEVTAVHYL